MKLFRLTQTVNGHKQVSKPLTREGATYWAGVQKQKSPKADLTIESEASLRAQGVQIPRRRK